VEKRDWPKWRGVGGRRIYPSARGLEVFAPFIKWAGRLKYG
jgi:hypothetical protein